MGRHASYKGLLETPFPYRGTSDQEGASVLQQKLGALAQHFALPYPSDEGLMIDLALALADRHETEFRKSNRLSKLFGKYEVDPSSKNAFLLLVVRLANAHVRGFRPAGPKRQRITNADLTTLCLADYSVRSKLLSGSQRMRARIFLNQVELTKFVGAEQAKEVHRILKSSGNRKAGAAGFQHELSERRLRELMAIFDDPMRASARRDPIARQLVKEVWPHLIFSSSHGQNARTETEFS